MQSVKSRIWTCVAMSNSCDDNHYTTGTSFKIGGIMAIGGIMVVGALRCCELLYSVNDLNATQMNMKCNLIQNLQVQNGP